MSQELYSEAPFLLRINFALDFFFSSTRPIQLTCLTKQCWALKLFFRPLTVYLIL